MRHYRRSVWRLRLRISGISGVADSQRTGLKMRIGKVKLEWTGVEWGAGNDRDGEEYFTYYVYWWNWLPARSRHFGYEMMQYDGYHNFRALVLQRFMVNALDIQENGEEK